jgi:syndecan 4
VLPCPQGEWSEAGSSTCTPCAAGSACTVGDQREFQCADGSIQSSTGKLHCSPCEPTTYASDTTTCTANVPGQGLTVAHLTPTNCPAGTYSDAATIADLELPDCQPCDAGALCPESSTTAQGSYWDAGNAAYA